MSSRSATPGPRFPQGHRRRLCAAVLVTGLAGALALGSAGIAAAAPVPAQRHGGVTTSVRGAGTGTAHVWPLLRHSAFPSVAHLANGGLLVVYRQGSNHYIGRDGFIRSTTSTDLGATWSAPGTLIPPAPGIDYRDPSVSTSNDGSRLYLTYYKGTTSISAAGSFFRSSTNGGATWTPEVRIDPKLPSSAITAPVVQLADGSLVAVHYSKLAGENRDSVWSSRSRDNGATWTITRLIDGQSADIDYQEPYLLRRGAGLFLTFRWGTNDSIGSTSSSDSGATWSTPAADFPGSGRPSSVWLGDGTIGVYLRDSAGTFKIRVTRDRGATWDPARTVQDPPTGGMSTYASLVEVSPGHVVTAMGAEDATGTRSRITFTSLDDLTVPGRRPVAAATTPMPVAGA
jgi:hypothetical protein